MPMLFFTPSKLFLWLLDKGQRIESGATPNQLAADTQIVWLKFKGKKAQGPLPSEIASNYK